MSDRWSTKFVRRENFFSIPTIKIQQNFLFGENKEDSNPTIVVKSHHKYFI